MSELRFLKIAVFNTDSYKPASQGKARLKTMQNLCGLFGFSVFYQTEFGDKQFDEMFGYYRNYYGQTFAIGYVTDDLSEMAITVVKHFCAAQGFEMRGFGTIPLWEPDAEKDEYMIQTYLRDKGWL